MNAVRLPLICLSLALLAACNSGTSKPAPVQQNLVAAPAPAAPAPARAKAPQPAPTPKQQASLPTAPVNDDPMQFMGMDIEQLSEAIGRPQFVRRDGTAEVWQYRGEGCFMDVFLYQQDGAFTVKYVDLRSPTLTEAQLRPCLADIIRAKTHTRPTS